MIPTGGCPPRLQSLEEWHEMFEFLTNVVSIEGPDCSGKTTLYNRIHSETDFVWNIRDRSFLSTLCYAKQYKRDTRRPEKGLEREVLNLNNKIIVVLPPKEVVRERLRRRGDDFQDEKSILDLHEIFSSESKKISGFPNVLVIKADLGPDALVEKCVGWLQSFSSHGPIDVGRMIRDTAIAAGGEAATTVSVDFSKTENFSDIMSHPREKDYYAEILKDTVEVFRAEFAGENPYRVRQDLGSRRFYYSSSSCISSVHFLVRNGLLKVFAQLRSTDVHRNASIDTKFLCHLSSYICDYFSFPVSDIALKIRFNCAHVRRDLPEWTKNEVVE